jgi:hypothetical protein
MITLPLPYILHVIILNLNYTEQYDEATKWKFSLYFITLGIYVLVLQKFLLFFGIANGTFRGV